MEKIVIISSTNRPDSNTLKVCKVYREILKTRGIESSILDMCVLPENIAFAELHGRRSAEYDQLILENITSASAFIFVVPEYNGSFPGLLKVFIDSIHPREWTDKFVCLVGVSNGRAGNLRGMEHLTGILNYLKLHIYHNKLPISSIDKQWDPTGRFNSAEQTNACVEQIEGFLGFISKNTKFTT
ncbi:MAG: NAD(P)H-dependent oxidoreductase [Bacteroidetes bacterium]|nr:NAD(P)H-dependent oxidoreductase [Bacteroidota bacterium]